MKLVFCYSVLGEYYSTKYTTGTDLSQQQYGNIPLGLFAQCTQFLNLDLIKELNEKGITETNVLVVGDEVGNINEIFNAMLLRSFITLEADWVLLINVTEEIPPEINQIIIQMFQESSMEKKGISGYPQYGVYLIPKSVLKATEKYVGINFENIREDYLKNMSEEVTIH